MKKSFVFYSDWQEVISGQSDAVRLELYDAVVRYGIRGELPNGLKPVASGIFALIKLQIDRDNEKYNDISIKRSLSGSLGGKQKQANLANDSKSSKCYLNDNDNVNDNDLNSELSNDNSSSAASRPTPKEEEINYQSFCMWFNETTKGVFGIAKYPFGDKRKASIRARIREHGKASLREVIKLAMQSNFLKGQNKSGFHATLDWLLKPSNYEKVLSENYSNNNQNEQTKTYQRL